MDTDLATDRKKSRLFKLATEAYRESDASLWVSALACAGVVGNYSRGATLELAAEMSLSTDSVENLAHAYSLYRELCEHGNGQFRQFVRQARRSSYIYYSHFRALWDAKSQYSLSIQRILDLLMDIVQGEGQISSRGVDGHIRGRYGDSRDWLFYAGKTMKELSKLIAQPDLPKTVQKKAQILFSEIGDNY